MNTKKSKIIVVFSSHLGESENASFTAHINKTIGIEHQVLCIENYNQFSLAEVYNKAILDNNSPEVIMVFCHPDIVFKTQNWGRILVNQFNHSKYGIIGVAGTVSLAKSGMWWEYKDAMYGIVEHTDGSRVWTSQYSKAIGIQEVVVIDGVFMAVDVEAIKHNFDPDFGKYHFYDLSFCLPNYMDGVNIGVTTNIRILHKSIGMVNEDWEKNKNKFAEKYRDTLPISLEPIYKEITPKLTSTPKVSVIIPTKNNLQYLVDNLMSWHNLVKYENYEIIIADTGSDPDVIKEYGKITNKKIRLVKYNFYNFAKINDDVVRNHTSSDTDLILFCNDDIELLNDALSRCVQVYNENAKNVGTIGIRLHYENGSVQHCGIEIYRDESDNIHLSHTDFKKWKNYSTNVRYDSLGNTGAFLMISKELYDRVGGLNPNYIECFEDVELNLACIIRHKKNITVCDAVAYHYESVTRNKDENKLDKLKMDYHNRLLPFYKKNRGMLVKYIPTIKLRQ